MSRDQNPQDRPPEAEDPDSPRPAPDDWVGKTGPSQPGDTPTVQEGAPDAEPPEHWGPKPGGRAG
jgi:hypothetical protein